VMRGVTGGSSMLKELWVNIRWWGRVHTPDSERKQSGAKRISARSGKAIGNPNGTKGGQKVGRGIKSVRTKRVKAAGPPRRGKAKPSALKRHKGLKYRS